MSTDQCSAHRRLIRDACRGDPTRRSHIAGLLDAHRKLGSFLELPPSAVAVDAGVMIEQPTERPGMQIGTYKLIQKNDHAAAVKAADGLAHHAFEPADVYNGARRISHCVSLAAADLELTPEKRNELAESYATHAVKLLRQAMAAGYQDAGHMKDDRFLDSIRHREEFNAVMLEMETKSKQKTGLTKNQ